jgi:hypothetical protein
MAQKCEPLIRGQRAWLPPMPGCLVQFVQPSPLSKAVGQTQTRCAAVDVQCLRTCAGCRYAGHFNLCIYITRVRLCSCAHTCVSILIWDLFILNNVCLLRKVIFLHNACQRWGTCSMLVTTDREEPPRRQANPASARQSGTTSGLLTIRGLMPYHCSQVHTDTCKPISETARFHRLQLNSCALLVRILIVCTGRLLFTRGVYRATGFDLMRPRVGY